MFYYIKTVKSVLILNIVVKMFLTILFLIYFKKNKADKYYAETGNLSAEDIPESMCKPKQIKDINSYITNKVYWEPENIKEWLDKLEYPLYYLDYETIQMAVPIFDESKPYDQIPFQFSLHIQKEKGGEVEHISFLYKERSDSRRALAECLVNSCEEQGSIIVYNQLFEKGRNEELAELFPDLKEKILALNKRVLDQLTPFRERYLYGPTQHSSASIKKTLPAFTDLSYENMEVHNGSEASSRYEAFITGKLSYEESKVLFDGLEKYCGQDTYAMVVLMDVLYK